MKTVKFYTLGCKVNQYETQDIREQFLSAGFKEFANASPADIYVINTCTVTHKADSESLGVVRRAGKENPRAKIIVTGCLAELDARRIRKEKVDLVVKNKDKGILLSKLQSLRDPAILSGRSDRGRNVRGSAEPIRGEANHVFSEIASSSAKNRGGLLAMTGISDFKGHTRAFLKIQDGCDNYCSYCKVPLVRGRSRSRPLKEIAREAERLVKNGFKEIVLTGICLGSYSFVGTAYYAAPTMIFSLVDVISALEKIEGLSRIRLSSIEAGDVSDALVAKMAASDKLCPHLHIPIQSGDDEVLKKMGRRYSRADYLRLIRKIKRRIPGVAITTDVLVGFPGESEQNFTHTLELVKEIFPSRAHIFPYSARKGTGAYKLSGEVDPITIRARILRLRHAVDKCALSFKKGFLNKPMEVLIEGPCKHKKGFWEGYTGNYIKVMAALDESSRNKVITLKIKKIAQDTAIAAA